MTNKNRELAIEVLKRTKSIAGAKMDIKDFEPLFGNWYVESFIGSGTFGKGYKIKREEFGANFKNAEC